MMLLYLALFSTAAVTTKTESKEAWGYVNVRRDAYMFWWLYYTDMSPDYSSHPLIVWLQGGPGGSSCGHGNFLEIGPLDIHLKPRNETWLKKANLLFIDSPVGSGYSYVMNKSDLAKSNKQIASDLVTTLSSVLQQVTEFQKSPLYIFGESYGGKIAVDFALELSKAIKLKHATVNFKGIALGDPWISPIDAIESWAQFLYSTSFIDKTEVNSIQPFVKEIRKSLITGKFKHATDIFVELQSFIENITYKVDWFNILRREGISNNSSLNTFLEPHRSHKLFKRHAQRLYSDKLYELMNGKVREKLHDIPKNVTWGGQSAEVFEALSEDFLKSKVNSVNTLLKNETAIDVTVYTGQLDLLANVLGTLKWVENLQWSGSKEFAKVRKKIVMLPENNVGGFVKSFKQFTFFWILKAGHMVPVDAPRTSLEMVDMILNKIK